MEQCRITVYFSGRVQGVGFRYVARETSEKYAVTGYVRNMRDGRVELVTEGGRSEIEQFVAAVKVAMGGYIHEAQESWGAATGEFRSFGIRF
jgi:acylphosphatase